MREIVTVQLGRCGNQIGCKFWEVMCDEHGITPAGTFCGDCNLQLGSINVYFNEGLGMRYVPRAVLVDLEPAALDACRCTPFGQIYRPDNFIFGRAGAGNNWAKGHYTEGVDLMDMTLETLRKEAECCEYLSGFQVLHSLGGGTGSGMGSLLLERIADEYHAKIVTTYSVCPSAKVSDTVVEPYNTILSVPNLCKFSDLTICLDNEALYRICHNVLRVPSPQYPDINHIISMVMSGMTCCLRFPGIANAGLRKLKVALTPFPNLHFFIPGFSPLSSRGVQPYRSLSLVDIVQQMLDGSTLMASVDPRSGKYITAAAIFRGNIPDGQLDQLLCDYQTKNSSHFVEWIPNYFTKAVCSIPPRGLKIAATFLANNTCIAGMWKRVREGYSKLFKRKAYLHWYYEEGMCEKDFLDAERSLIDLIKEYQQYENALPEVDDDEGEDDEYEIEGLD